jgi:glycine betaine/proline transport system substrate-binding protein
MNKKSSYIPLKALLFAVFAALALPAGAVESKDPIKLTLHDWTGQYLTTTLMGEVLKKAGYNIEYVQADYIAQFAGLESGDLHVAMEMWETTGKQAMDASLATGKTVDLGETGMDAKEEWWYPMYMKDRCPGLPDWKALNKCAEAFATPETAPKGRYLGGPVTWAGFDDERVEALELDYEVVHAGTDAALFGDSTQGAYFAVGLCTALGGGQVPGRMGRVSRVYRRLLRRCELGYEQGHGLRLRQAFRLDQEGRLERR